MEKSRYKTIMINMKIIRSSFTDTWNIINMSTYCREDQLVERSRKTLKSAAPKKDQLVELSKTKFKSAPPKSESFL